MDPCIVVHGGSRTIPTEDLKERYIVGVQEATKAGYEALLKVESNDCYIVCLKA